jgi:SAM-dependent methyltransferase
MTEVDFEAVEQIELDTWTRAAKSYLESTAKLTSHPVPYLLELSELTAGSRALEVAGGPGHVCALMAESGASITGVDLVPAMISTARRTYSGIDFLEANAERLPFDDGTFDVVLINYSIHHFARPDVVVAQVKRVLKSGGRFVFAGPLEQFAFGAFVAALTEFHTLEVLAHGPLYLGATVEDYEALVSAATFSSWEVEGRQSRLSLSSLDPLLQTGWEMCGLGSLPMATQEKIRAATLLNAEPYRADDGYVFQDRIVVGVATK